MIPIIIYTHLTICTISLNFSKLEKFIYNTELIVLKQPEYDNATTKTAGIPRCATGKITFGWASQKPVGGFMLDRGNNFFDINSK